MNQRKHPRKTVDLTGSVRGEALFAEGTLVNLSKGGCAFRCDSALEVGNFLEVEIDLPDQEPPLKIEVAVVRWTRGQGFGVEFLRIHPSEEERLRQVVTTSQWMHNWRKVLVGLRPGKRP